MIYFTLKIIKESECALFTLLLSYFMKLIIGITGTLVAILDH